MIKISNALKSEALNQEWDNLDIIHYGKKIDWIEKHFRFKAVEDNKLLGTIEGKLEADTIYISTLITKESAGGKGIGTLLVQKAEDFGKKNKAHKIWLLTGKNWSENIFYTKLGFQLVGNLDNFYFNQDFVIYTKEIK